MTSSAPQSEPGQDGVTTDPKFDLKRLTDELIGLRARKGLVYEQVRDCPTLIKIAAQWKRNQASKVAHLDDVRAAIRMITDALEDERPIEDRDSLKVTYGLIVDGPSRDERVRRYLELSKAQRTVHSGPSIERHSRSMAEQLAVKLASTTFSLGSNEAVIKAQAANDYSGLYTTDLVRTRYRIVKGRFLKDMFYERTITSLVSGSHTLLLHNVIWSDDHEGVSRAEPEFGCEVVRDYHEGGVYSVVLRVSKTLSVGESFEIAYRMHVDSTIPCDNFVSITPTTNVGKWDCYIEFAEDAIPKAYWTFNQAHYLNTRHREGRRQVAHVHDGSRYISESWRDLHAGLSYGIEWDW